MINATFELIKLKYLSSVVRRACRVLLTTEISKKSESPNIQLDADFTLNSFIMYAPWPLYTKACEFLRNIIHCLENSVMVSFSVHVFIPFLTWFLL